jgi:hypothetical protein
LLFNKSPTIAARGLVIRQRGLAGFYVHEIFHETIIVPLNFFRRLATHGLGHILPAVWGVFVVYSQGLLE